MQFGMQINASNMHAKNAVKYRQLYLFLSSVYTILVYMLGMV